MESNPKNLVSVLLPTFNGGAYLRPALMSILKQTYKNLEIIIIDDGSTDDSVSTIIDIIDNRVRIIRQENRGRSAALNKGLELLNGEYWIIQDADDLSYPSRVENLLYEMSKKKDLAAAFSGHDLLIDDLQFAPIFSSLTVTECKVLINDFKIPGHDPTAMYRSSITSKFRFDTNLKVGQGLDFILRVGENYPISRINKCLYTYRIHSNSATRKKTSTNTMWINQVIKKACIRRKLDFSDKIVDSKSFHGKQINTKHHDVVPQCMNSVVDLKSVGRNREALRIGLQCLMLEPFNYSFYKPMIYSLTPLYIIKKYREKKEALILLLSYV